MEKARTHKETEKTEHAAGPAKSVAAPAPETSVTSSFLGSTLAAVPPISIQEKCSCGGTCAACSSQGGGGQTLGATGIPRPGWTGNRRPAFTPSSAGPGAEPIPWGALNGSHGSHAVAGARLHYDSSAARVADQLDALAVTIGRDIYFGRGQYAPETEEGRRLLRHELTHVVQAGLDSQSVRTRAFALATPDHPAELEAGRIAETGGAAVYRTSTPTVFRQVTPRAAARLTRAQIFGNAAAPASGLTLEQFRSYTQERQADWFVQPTLTGAPRDDLWRLLLIAEEGPQILAGIGDVKIRDLNGVPFVDWAPLREFCRGAHVDGHTIRMFQPFPPLADRIALGRTLLGLEAVIPGPVLEITASQDQLVQLQTQALLPTITTYWTAYQPHIEQTFNPAPGARGPEFERVLVFLNSLGAPGLGALTPLRGGSPAERWVRDLHRFPIVMLQRLVTNLGDVSGVKRLILVLHTGHDPPGAFQQSANLFSDLVTTSPNNLVLMIEGAISLAAITTRIPVITARWGQIVAGVRRISQVLIAGHGSAQTAGMAGTSAPNVVDQAVQYNEESLVTQQPATRALLDALFTHMPPATARILYAGCLVGSTHAPAGTAAADIPAALAANQSLAAYTQARATAAGIPAGRVQAARASVALGNATSLSNAAGDLAITYPFDPNAFGTAQTYASTGREPEGVLRAAVEVGAVNLATAQALLRTRLAMAAAGEWYDHVTRLMVTIALPPVGNPLDLHRVIRLRDVFVFGLECRDLYRGRSGRSTAQRAAFPPGRHVDRHRSIRGAERAVSLQHADRSTGGSNRRCGHCRQEHIRRLRRPHRRRTDLHRPRFVDQRHDVDRPPSYDHDGRRHPDAAGLRPPIGERRADYRNPVSGHGRDTDAAHPKL